MIGLLPLLYLSSVLVAGLLHRRGAARDEAGFFLAGRSAGRLLLAGSLAATTLGSFGVMGVAGLAYANGLTAGWYLWGGLAGLMLLALWALPRLEPEGAYTLPELLGRAYGPASRRLVGALIVVAWLGILAAQLIAAGKILQFLGVQSGWWAADSGAVLQTCAVAVLFAVYTVLGGQAAIMRTDLLQALVVALGLVVIVAAVAFGQPASPPAVLPPGHLHWPVSDALPALDLLLLVLTFGVPFLIGPDIYSRVLSGRDRAAMRGGLVAGGILLVPMVLLVVLGGISARVVLGPEVADPNTVLLELASVVLSPLGAGLIVAALLAAVMSSADTILMTMSTIAMRDVLPTGGWSEARRVSASRWTMAAATVAATVVALHVQEIVAALRFCYQLYSPMVLLPFVAMVVFPRRRFRGITGVSAFLAGAGTAAAGLAAGAAGLPALGTVLGYTAFGAGLIPIAIELGLRTPPLADTSGKP